MKKIMLPITAITMLVIGAGVSAYADDTRKTLKPNEVVAKVNGKDILVMDWTAEFQSLPQQDQTQGEDALFNPLVNALVEKVVISDEAIADGLDKTEDYKTLLRKAKRDILSQMYVNQKIGKILENTDFRAEYDAQVKKWKNEVEVQSRHILLKSRKDAQDIIVALQNGGDFKALAKQKSTGPTGANGGDLGWVAKGAMVPEFEKALFALKDGAISETPVKTQFGWHVIKREQSRKKDIPPFETVEPQLRQQVIMKNLNTLVQGLVGKAKIKDVLHVK